MSFVIGLLLSLGGILGILLVWQMLPRDPVGPVARTRRNVTGFQGQATEWLYWDAPLTPPEPKHIDKPLQAHASGVADRLLRALVGRVAVERQVTLDKAHKALLDEAKDPRVQAFLRGKLNRAVRAHWRRGFHGPPALFPFWFYVVAYPRHGRRYLVLETLNGIMKEMQRP